MINISPKYLTNIYRLLPNFMWPLKWYIKKISLKKVGRNFRFGHTSRFRDHRLIEIGNDVLFGANTYINTIVPVTIGNNVMFGPNVTLVGGNHKMSTIGKQMRFVKEIGDNKPIIIENDVWVGSNVIILKGVTIGEGTIIGAGSVVTKSLMPYFICYGNPCAQKKARFTKSELKKHLSMVKSKYSLE